MYNDNNNNKNGYDGNGYNNQNNFYGSSNSNYRGYNPYEQNNNYNNYNNFNNNGGGNGGNKKGGKSWLIVLVAVLGALVISALSIGVYAAITGNTPKNNKPVEWSEPPAAAEDEKTEDKKEPEKEDEEVMAAEGTSDKYSFTPSVSVAGDLTPEQVAEKLIPSVVCIQNYQKVVYQSQNSIFGHGGLPAIYEKTEEIKLFGEGSGIVITEDGYIATNAHVVDGAEIIKVVLSDETEHEAKLVGIDPDTDLAVIKVEAEGLTKAELGSSGDVKVGQYVMAVGNPGGLEFASSVTLGIASAVDRPLEISNSGYTMSTIQTDASINPGNSGGALVNMKGQVIGINSAKYVDTGYEGLGFAITIDEALPIIKDLMDYGKVNNRSMLGVNGTMLDEVTAEYYKLKEGFYVYSVVNENPGSLKGGDVITAINGEKITKEINIKNIIKNMPPGTKVEIEYYRSADDAFYTTELELIEYTGSED